MLGFLAQINECTGDPKEKETLKLSREKAVSGGSTDVDDSTSERKKSLKSL